MDDQYNLPEPPVAWADWLNQDQADWALKFDGGFADNPFNSRNESSATAASVVLPDSASSDVFLPLPGTTRRLPITTTYDTVAFRVSDGFFNLGTSFEYESDSMLGANGVELSRILDTNVHPDGIAEQPVTLFPGSSCLKTYRRVAYFKKTCASCNTPLSHPDETLDIEHPICTKSNSANHLQLECNGCRARLNNIAALRKHCRNRRHYRDISFHCIMSECNDWVGAPEESLHWRIFHWESNWDCSECNMTYNTREGLEAHNINSSHCGFACRIPGCGSKAIRFNELCRHQLSHLESVLRYSCPHCHKYRGNNGFKRKDHLRQHIRKYHHIDDDVTNTDRKLYSPTIFECGHGGCNRVATSGFKTKLELSAHLKKDHPSPFQCSQPGCHRIGINGWLRRTDMIKHLKEENHITHRPDELEPFDE